jgi:primary-amine oxidase
MAPTPATRPRWTEKDRPIGNTDVVRWYTFGHTHLLRPEDYPVMPTAYVGFYIDAES